MPSKITWFSQLRGLLSTLRPDAGLMPTANLGTGTANSTTFLRGDQTYATISSGIGGTTGVTDNRIIRSDGIGGSTIQTSAIALDDSGNMTGLANFVAGAGSFAVTTSFDAVVWQGGKLGFANAAVNGASTPDAYLVRNGASSLGVKGVSGVDGAITCGTFTASGTISPGTVAVSSLPSAAANTGRFINVSDSNTQTIGDNVAGGGALNVTVRSDGTNWKVWSGTASGGSGLTHPQVLARSFARC